MADAGMSITSEAYACRPLRLSCSSSCNAAMNHLRIQWSGKGSAFASSTVAQSGMSASHAPQLHGYPRADAHNSAFASSRDSFSTSTKPRR